MSTEEEIDLINKMLQDSVASNYQVLPVGRTGQSPTVSSGIPNWVTSKAIIDNEWRDWLSLNGIKQNIVGVQEPTHYNFFKKLKLIK